MNTGYYLPTHYPTPTLSPERIAALRAEAELEAVQPEIALAPSSERIISEPERLIEIEKYKRKMLMSILHTGSHTRTEAGDGGVVVTRATQALMVHKVINSNGMGSKRPTHTQGRNFMDADEWFILRKRSRWLFRIADTIKKHGEWAYEWRHRKVIVAGSAKGYFVSDGKTVLAGENFCVLHARWNIETGEDE